MKYGNCLMNALLAKIKNWKEIKIVFLSRKITGKQFHVVWINLKNNTVSHYVRNSKGGNLIWYKGRIKTVSKEVYDRFIASRIKELLYVKEQMLHLKYDTSNYVDTADWHTPKIDGLPTYDKGLPFTKKNPQVLILKKRGSNIQAEIKKIDDIKDGKNIVAYQYLNHLMPCYYLLFGNTNTDDFLITED